jgi:cell division topological specificity factor
MNGLRFLRPLNSAPVARERLQILLEYDRHAVHPGDLFVILREQISAVVGRHVTIDPNRAQVREIPGATILTVAVDIEVPHRVHSSAMARHVRGGDGRKLPAFP